MADGALFGGSFLDRYAGQIIADPATAIVELVANAWDAHATLVDIVWPEPGKPFAIRDNGHGMTCEEFVRRWRTLSYDRTLEQGERTIPPSDAGEAKPRIVYGRNGKGRLAAFLFGSPYLVRSWRDGRESLFKVSRAGSSDSPFHVDVLSSHDAASGHGTEIKGADDPVGLAADDARKVIGARFLTDPSFVVRVNGTPVSFEDLSDDNIVRTEVIVPGRGTVEVLMIAGERVDRSTRQHGIAWWVNNRLVGDCRWRGNDLIAVLDGRTSEAKRFTFIVLADFLEAAVKADWSDFESADPAWTETRPLVIDHIRSLIRDAIGSRRAEAKEEVRTRLSGLTAKLAPLGREIWDQFIDEVVDTCPSITTDQVTQVAEILARLEVSGSKYELIDRLHGMASGDLDALARLLTDWSVRTAKEALDEISARLRLIKQMHETLRNDQADEVQDLQPLFERSLWAFGPEFESLEFTSNRGMSTVIRTLFNKRRSSSEEVRATGSRDRPDFAILPDSSVGFFTRPSFDQEGEPIGTAHLVIVELKRPGILIGAPQMEQARSYVRELRKKGHLEDASKVTCFVLGSKRDFMETEPVQQGSVTTIAITFDAFITRAERRMLNLYDKVRDAPFLAEQGVDLSSFGHGVEVAQKAIV